MDLYGRKSVRRDGGRTPNGERVYLEIIVVHPSVFERIEDCFQTVIDITPSIVRSSEHNTDLEWAREPVDIHCVNDPDHSLAIDTTIFGE